MYWPFPMGAASPDGKPFARRSRRREGRQIHLDTFSNVTLEMQIVDRIAALIVGGKLKAGATLPIKRELIGRLGVSRSTVSEGYERLVAEGHVATARGRHHDDYAVPTEAAELGRANCSLAARPLMPSIAA